MLRATPLCRELDLRTTSKATVEPAVLDTAVAAPQLLRNGRAARLTKPVVQKAASGVRLYEVAVPLAEDPGKVRGISHSCMSESAVD